MKKSEHQRDTESKIIGHVLAAFAEATDYEPDTKSLVMRVDYDEEIKQFTVSVYNDAFKDEQIKPIEVRGHFHEVEDVKEHRDESVGAVSISLKSKDVNVSDIPTVYDLEEFLAIYDEAVLNVLAQIVKSAGRDTTAATRRTLAAVTAAEIKAELRRQVRDGAKV